MRPYRDFVVPIGHPMVIAIGLVAVLANVSAIERLWAIAKAVRAREAATAVRRAAQVRHHESGDETEVEV